MEKLFQVLLKHHLVSKRFWKRGCIKNKNYIPPLNVSDANSYSATENPALL